MAYFNFAGLGKDDETIICMVNGTLIYYSTDPCSSKSQNYITRLQKLRAAAGDNTDRIEVALAVTEIAKLAFPDTPANEPFWAKILMLKRSDIQPMQENDEETRNISDRSYR